VNDSERRAALDLFYGELARLDDKVGGRRQLSLCDGRMRWPKRGVYFFFEEGEFREDGITPRVVRVGTHALRPSSSTLWKRLSAHKGSPGGSLPGGGNHRGSIFRLHVGTALLAAAEWSSEVQSTWGHGSTAPRAVREAEYSLEMAVTHKIGMMPFLWVNVDDEPHRESARGVIESGTIALLSNFDREPIDQASSGWLGHHANRDAVKASGLWNVNHVAGPPINDFLPVLSHFVDATSFK